MLVHEIISRGRDSDIAIIDAGRSITYAGFAQAVKNFRNRLYALGVREGDRVALFSRNSAEFIFAYMATASLGAIIVPINFQLSSRETNYIIENSEAKFVLTYEKLDTNFTQYDIATFGEMPCDVEAPELPADFDENKPCAIIYTSGTTGNPKGAVLSHKNLVHNTWQCSVFKTHRACKVLCVLPMYHCYAWTCAVLNTFYCGAEAHVVRMFKPKEVVDVIREHEITDLVIVPSIFKLITALAKPEDFRSVRFSLSGGAILPEKIIQDFTEKFGLPIAEVYGLSEASPAVLITPCGEERVGSCGKILAGEELRIVDANGNDAPIGELLVRGAQVMLGYWKNPAATAEAIDKDGWLHTGDVMKSDADGYAYIVSRIKELIISMGENIYPREVEEIVYEFPGIKAAAVVGVEDKLRGQVGACFYEVWEGKTVDPRELKKFLQKNLALYKVPREFHELAEIPRTSTGKISKRQILEDFLRS